MTLRYSRVLVAADGSKEAAWAVKKAIDIAVRNRAALYLTYIIHDNAFGMIEAYDRTSGAREKSYAKELLAGYQEKAVEAGVEQVDIIIERGSPKILIPQELAPRIGADLIVCGATGLNAGERLILGSVSERIVRYAKCDVLVVRTDDLVTG
ncbi:universal stress protein [Planococcus salinus]|uniref:Universal stress protein n=1 Tax=Planococcus salinus TaxID=1848460 RepID=A0A3M8P9D7_9BACL|nr:universal stress protein [Planococcus salinus]RNF39870.1 universal stress protein [Planococcus salinus]